MAGGNRRKRTAKPEAPPPRPYDPFYSDVRRRREINRRGEVIRAQRWAAVVEMYDGVQTGGGFLTRALGRLRRALGYESVADD